MVLLEILDGERQRRLKLVDVEPSLFHDSAGGSQKVQVRFAVRGVISRNIIVFFVARGNQPDDEGDRPGRRSS